ncbi:MAG: WecB/TagA/CpsF family glycosyltransferase [Kiritimatiellaeota bacterium]|nr:WecB/TagA/CpsF family glycosyltransferase [Kiritimatiellota bacterium]
MMHIENRVNILGVGVNATSMDDAVTRLVEARRNGESGYVCVTGAHGVMESQRDEQLRQIHNRSLMTVPDGMPNVWLGHEYGFVKMGRVYGPDLMLALCAATSEVVECRKSEVGSRGETVEGGAWKVECEQQHPTFNIQHPTTDKKCLTHFLYGATEETLRKLKANLEQRFPGIQIVGTYAPPFRPLTEEEELDLRRQVAACKPDFFWVGLSTPKQERFMFAHCAKMNVGYGTWDVEGEQESVEGGTWKVGSGEQHPTSNILLSTKKYPLDAGIFIGVGAAFDIHAGNYKDSPQWIQNAGLQWLHRLCKEPRRLWRRYLWIVPGFLWLSFLQLMGLKRFASTEDCERKA